MKIAVLAVINIFEDLQVVKSTDYSANIFFTILTLLRTDLHSLLLHSKVVIYMGAYIEGLDITWRRVQCWGRTMKIGYD